MIKKFLAAFIAAFILTIPVAFATFPVTPVTGGGTGMSTIPVVGYLLIGSGTAYGFISSSTFYLASNPSGYITGNQTVALTGPITGSGTTTIATTIVSPFVIAVANHTTITATTSITSPGSVNTNILNVSSTSIFVGVAMHNGITNTGNVTTTSETVTGVLQDGQGNKYSTSTSGGTSSGNLFVSPTSTILANNVVKFQTTGSSTVAQSSSLYSFNTTGDIAVNTSTDKGLLNIVTTAGQTALSISTSTLATSTPSLNILGSSSTPTTNYSVFQILGDGHINSTGTLPAVSSCGTSPSIIGTDSAGVVTVGSVTATGCTVTFQIPLESSNYSLQITSETSLATSLGVSSKTNTGFTVSDGVGSIVGDKIDYTVIMNL